MKILLLIGLMGVLVIAVINLWVEGSTASRIYTEVDEMPNRKIAVVLGTSSRVASGRRNLFFTYRMDATADLYHAGKVRKVLVSGDNALKEYDEPSDMRTALIERGIPPGDIVLDYAGFRTFDSVVRTRDVFGQDSVIFVSQKSHVQRALFIARSKKMEGLGYVASDPPPTQKVLKVRLREWLARVKAFLDCYILGTTPKFPGPPEPIQF